MKMSSGLATKLAQVILVGILLGAGAASARAASFYSWTWTGADWNGSGVLGVDSTNTVKWFNGSINGRAITGLAGTDFKLYPERSFVLDYPGIEFFVGDAKMRLNSRIFLSCDCQQYILWYDIAPDGSEGGQSGSFAIAQLATTPLPPALLLFATGVGALGLVGWRRRCKNAGARG